MKGNNDMQCKVSSNKQSSNSPKKNYWYLKHSAASPDSAAVSLSIKAIMKLRITEIEDNWTMYVSPLSQQLIDSYISPHLAGESSEGMLMLAEQHVQLLSVHLCLKGQVHGGLKGRIKSNKTKCSICTNMIAHVYWISIFINTLIYFWPNTLNHVTVMHGLLCLTALMQHLLSHLKTEKLKVIVIVFFWWIHL